MTVSGAAGPRLGPIAQVLPTSRDGSQGWKECLKGLVEEVRLHTLIEESSEVGSRAIC